VLSLKYLATIENEDLLKLFLRNESTLNVVGKVLPKDRTKTLIAIQKHEVHENYPKGELSNHQDHHGIIRLA